jgi:hypothetical protein
MKRSLMPLIVVSLGILGSAACEHNNDDSSGAGCQAPARGSVLQPVAMISMQIGYRRT